jgi:hypothetical protein
VRALSGYIGWLGILLAIDMQSIFMLLEFQHEYGFRIYEF